MREGRLSGNLRRTEKGVSSVRPSYEIVSARGVYQPKGEDRCDIEKKRSVIRRTRITFVQMEGPFGALPCSKLEKVDKFLSRPGFLKKMPLGELKGRGEGKVMREAAVPVEGDAEVYMIRPVVKVRLSSNQYTTLRH